MVIADYGILQITVYTIFLWMEKIMQHAKINFSNCSEKKRSVKKKNVETPTLDWEYFYINFGINAGLE